MFHEIGDIDDIHIGQKRCMKLAGRSILVLRTDTNLFACSAICTHEHAELTDGLILDDTIECPLHGSVFNLKDGQVEFGPAEEPLPVYTVSIRNGRIGIDIPEEDL